MEKCEQCRKPIVKGASLRFGVKLIRFCEGSCAIRWNRHHGQGATFEISFDGQTRRASSQF